MFIFRPSHQFLCRWQYIRTNISKILSIKYRYNTPLFSFTPLDI
jgi:hypothetical protein